MCIRDRTSDADYVTGALQSMGADAGSGGWILVETNERQENAFTRSAIVRIFSLVMLVSLVVAFSLLLFSAWLALRIRNMRQLSR